MAEQTPEQTARTMVDAFNRRDLDAFMALYEPEASLVFEPGQVASSPKEIHAAIGGFLALEGRMEIEPELTVVRADDIALVSAALTIDGTDPDGEPVTMSGKTTDMARRQPDGTWRWVIDAPFGVGR